jgi:hypothetical protein
MNAEIGPKNPPSWLIEGSGTECGQIHRSARLSGRNTPLPGVVIPNLPLSEKMAG